MRVEEMRLDGNAAAGALREIFAHDMTTALVTCAGCARASPMGVLMNYGGPMGVILRCPHCDTVMLRIVSTPGGRYMDASGSSVMLIPERPT